MKNKIAQSFKGFILSYLLIAVVAGGFMTQSVTAQAHEAIPAYAGLMAVALENNIPCFTPEEITAVSYEVYGELDELGRCTVAQACIGIDLMPTEERGEIGQIQPTGWAQNKYPGLVNSDPPYLYNRCHLFGYQLSGENANEKNLITGTRYFNVEGMLPYENLVTDYVKTTHNHVMYRVTPVFEGTNLLATGVQMEAYSVEDAGAGVCFNVFCYNIQPGVLINYADGSNAADPNYIPLNDETQITGNTTREGAWGTEADCNYVANKNTKKFHYATCSSVSSMNESNKWYYDGTRDELIAMGYDPCKRCHP